MSVITTPMASRMVGGGAAAIMLASLTSGGRVDSMNYWLQRDAYSPAEGPLPKAEILLMLKRRHIDLTAVVTEQGQESWRRVEDVFATELRKWRWERFMVKWTMIGLGTAAVLIAAWVMIQNAVNHYNSPEAEAARYQAEREATLREAAELQRWDSQKQTRLRSAEAAPQKAWQTASAKEDYTLSANEREDVLAIIVRLTSDPDAALVEISSTATQETLECIVKFESRQKQRLWRMVMNRLNGDLWSVADRETGKMIWSLLDQ